MPSASKFTAPEDIVLLTFVLELPVDVGMPDVSGVIALMRDDHLFAGWRSEAVVALTGALNFAIPEGTRPATRLMFRRARVRTHLPLQAADATFGAWAERLWSRRDRVRRRLKLRYLTWRGLREVRSVVALTRFLHVRTLPDPGGDPVDYLMDQESLLTTEFDLALRSLNDFLVSLGVSSPHPDIGPIAAADVPGRVPVILEHAGLVNGRRVGGTFFHTIHFRRPRVADEPVPQASLHAAVQMFNAVQRDEEPLFGFFELWHRAELDAASGRYNVAVVQLGAAMEVLFSVIVRVMGVRRGRTPEDMTAVLETALTNIVVDHLPRYIGRVLTREDLRTEGHAVGQWWLDGYALRNRVAHEGHRATDGEVEMAQLAARWLVWWLGAALARQDDGADLGERLLWLVKPSGEGDDAVVEDDDGDC